MTKRPTNVTSSAAAEALVAEARDLVHRGKFAEATPLLDEAAALFRQSRNAAREAACLHLAATAARLLGDLPGASRRADRAARLAPAGSRESIAADAERAQIAAAAGDHHAASIGLAGAISEAEGAGWQGQPLAALVRQHARMLALDGRLDPALGELSRATALVEETDDQALLWARIEEGTALLATGQTDAAEAAIDIARDAVRASGDHLGLAQIALLDVARAVQARDTAAASEAAEDARAEALEARAPIAYLASSVAIAELADHEGDRMRAYGTLATTLVTLGDLIGRAEGRALAEPHLIELRDRWGAAAFDALKLMYEGRRRCALAASEADGASHEPDKAE